MAQGCRLSPTHFYFGKLKKKFFFLNSDPNGLFFTSLIRGAASFFSFLRLRHVLACFAPLPRRLLLHTTILIFSVGSKKKIDTLQGFTLDRRGEKRYFTLGLYGGKKASGRFGIINNRHTPTRRIERESLLGFSTSKSFYLVKESGTQSRPRHSHSSLVREHIFTMFSWCMKSFESFSFLTFSIYFT